jgi:hypothetical protein
MCWNGALYLPCAAKQITITATSVTEVTEGILPILTGITTTHLVTGLTTYRSNGHDVEEPCSSYITAVEGWTGIFFPENPTGSTITVTTVRTTTSTPSTTIYTALLSGVAPYTRTVTGSTANTVIYGEPPNARTTRLSTLAYGAASVSSLFRLHKPLREEVGRC